jgi:predicted TIM-barrel fold metal-dependent hydrolase
MIVDAQIQIWAKGTPSAHHRQEPYSKDQALASMNTAGVDRAVIHPPMWDPDSNELAVDAARAHPDRFAILGWRQCVTLFTEELPWMKGQDLELVIGRAFCDWIGWKLPEH